MPPHRLFTLLLGALTGTIGLIAMIRLVGGLFGGRMSIFALVFTLIAMLPWVVYVAWRAMHGRLAPLARGGVLLLDVVGLVLVWLFTLGPVLALVVSFAAFLIIWASDLPRRRPGSESRFVPVDELGSDEG